VQLYVLRDGVGELDQRRLSGCAGEHWRREQYGEGKR
jgi:hypothetical protein